jgi:large subunit ribosomal protein L22
MSKPKGSDGKLEKPKARTATLRWVRISPRKVRLVADMVRGEKVESALGMLNFVPRRGAKVVSKLIASALSNAQNDAKLDPDSLVVEKIFVDSGPTVKRWRPRAMGRANRINKKTCHVTVWLGEK